MEYLREESVSGKYDVYLHETGEKYIVLEGLDPRQIHEPGVIETFMHNHYSLFEVLYWLLFAATLVFVVGNYICIPLLQKYKKAENSKTKSI